MKPLKEFTLFWDVTQVLGLYLGMLYAEICGLRILQCHCPVCETAMQEDLAAKSVQWELAELPLADVSLPHDPMMPEIKLGSHLLPNHLAFMKEVNDKLT